MSKIQRNLNRFICVVTVFLMFPVICMAEQGLYIAGGAGLSTLEAIGMDEDDVAYRGVVGWGFNDYIAIESGYARLGSFERMPIAGLSELTIVEAEINSLTASAVLTIPITQSFTLLARAGALYYDAEWRHIVDTGDGTIETLSTNFFDDNGTDYSFGAGVLYRFNEKVALRGEWERFRAGEFDVDAISTYLQVNFW